MKIEELKAKYPLVGDSAHREMISEMIQSGALWCCAVNYCDVEEMCYCDDEDHALDREDPE